MVNGGFAQGDTDLLIETREELEPGDHERFAHYVKKEKIVESAVTGKPVKIGRAHV